MPLLKNTAGQKLCVQARDGAGAPVTGDAANISCKVAKDHGSLAALGDASPVELESGYYVFDLTQAETNADHLLFVPVSSSGSTYVHVVNRANGRTDGWSPLVAARLDTTVSSRLRADGYNPPDNAGIAAVRARTDNLPESPAAVGDIPTAAENRAEMDSSSTQLAKLGVPVGASLAVDIAAGKAVADAIRAKTDNLPANPADVSDVPTAAQIEAALINEGDGQQLIDAILTVINSSLDVPALELAAIAGAVRSELATELGRLDAAVSSRLAAAGYTAPDNAGISTAVAQSTLAASAAADASANAIAAAGAAGDAEAAALAAGAATVSRTPFLNRKPGKVIDVSDRADSRHTQDRVRAAPGERVLVALAYADPDAWLYGMELPVTPDAVAMTVSEEYGVNRSWAMFEVVLAAGVAAGAELSLPVVVQPTEGTEDRRRVLVEVIDPVQ
ncbi:hypothetical protein KOR34_02240 [Posidoniimonas corsicana]|uniref:Uncharacterized protein n=1 Tax=Posidoniimonas corsicana TaxID=1938618 RepID=A0A5C5V9R2_9BACT|nr:hypothetical protein [Posidoniimonas corsicana]TWT35334.1 hypothetical protein KOR34_02240 [Posidoniimonas corsicana]